MIQYCNQIKNTEICSVAELSLSLLLLFDDEFPHKSLSHNSASDSNLLLLFSSWSKTTFDVKGHFLVAMGNLQFQGRKNSFYYIKVHVGHWADH